jgi:hypothetical protein
MGAPNEISMIVFPTVTAFIRGAPGTVLGVTTPLDAMTVFPAALNAFRYIVYVFPFSNPGTGYVVGVEPIET